MTKEQKLDKIWKTTHHDFRSTFTRAIMVCRNGATVFVRMEDLTDKEINDRLPSKNGY